MFSRRSIVFGTEYALPFHLRYYLPLRERGLQIARAQYSDDPHFLTKVIRDQKIDFFLIDSRAFTPSYWQRSRSLRQLRSAYPNEPLGIRPGVTPVLEHAPPATIAFKDKRFVVIDAHRLVE